MDFKSKILLGIFILVIAVVVGELVFIFFLQKHNTFPFATALPTPTPAPVNVPAGGINIAQSPAGFYIEPTSQDLFLFIGKLSRVYQESKGDIKADVSFGFNNGTGPQGKQTVLLMSGKTKANFLLTKQNVPGIFVAPSQTKLVKIPYSQIVSELQKYINSTLLFTFQLTGPKPADTNATILPNPISPCNKAFLLYIKARTPVPPCMPQPSQINVYETF